MAVVIAAVGRVLERSTGEPGHRICYAGDILEGGLDTPEATTGKDSGICLYGACAGKQQQKTG